MTFLPRVFTSVRTAAVLISYLVVSSAASVFIPGFSFFSSPFFLVPVFLFTINLASCIVMRFTRELGKKGLKNHGPDIIHIGIIILITGAAFSAAGKTGGLVELSAGGSALLPSGYLIRIDSIDLNKYPDGTVKDYITTADLSLNGREITNGFKIKVNHPLKAGSFLVCQGTFDEKEKITGLIIVSDPGYPAVITGFLIISIGLCLTFAIKLYRQFNNYSKEKI